MWSYLTHESTVFLFQLCFQIQLPLLVTLTSVTNKTFPANWNKLPNEQYRSFVQRKWLIFFSYPFFLLKNIPLETKVSKCKLKCMYLQLLFWWTVLYWFGEYKCPKRYCTLEINSCIHKILACSVSIVIWKNIWS